MQTSCTGEINMILPQELFLCCCFEDGREEGLCYCISVMSFLMTLKVILYELYCFYQDKNASQLSPVWFHFLQPYNRSVLWPALLVPPEALPVLNQFEQQFTWITREALSVWNENTNLTEYFTVWTESNLHMQYYAMLQYMCSHKQYMVAYIVIL